MWPIDTPGLDRFGNLVPIPQNRQIFFNTPQTAIVNCPDGNPFSFTVAAGQFAAFSQLLANAEALSFALLQAENHLLCIGNLTNTLICANTEYSDAVVGSGAFLTNANACWAVFGVLPPGVEIDLDFVGGCFTGSTTLHFFGTPTVPGSYSFAIQLEDGAGDFMVKNVTLNVAGITNGDEIPNGTVGEAYDAQFSVFGFTNPVFSIESGMLPDGLSMSNTGEITGTPTMQDEETFTVQVTELTTGFTCLQDVQLIVMQGCAKLPVISTTVNNAGQVTAFRYGGGKHALAADDNNPGNVEIFNATTNWTQDASANIGGAGNLEFSAASYSKLADRFLVGVHRISDDETFLYFFRVTGAGPFGLTFTSLDLANIANAAGTAIFSTACDDATGTAYVLHSGKVVKVNTVAQTVTSYSNSVAGGYIYGGQIGYNPTSKNVYACRTGAADCFVDVFDQNLTLLASYSLPALPGPTTATNVVYGNGNLYVAGNDGGLDGGFVIWVLKASNGALVATIRYPVANTVFSWQQWMLFNASNGQIYQSYRDQNGTDRAVWVVCSSNNSSTGILDFGGNVPDQVAFADIANSIVVGTGNSTLAVYSLPM